MYFVGIDIGSTSCKVAVFEEDKLVEKMLCPTGWSSLETSKLILENLKKLGIDEKNSKIVATGYGRVSVPYANKAVTEITCHGKGASYIFNQDGTVLDVGGQDTKVISIENGMVKDFIMNDKCSAGTGKFIEIMANRMGLTINDLSRLAKDGGEVTISSMCTVFAESEVISLIGQGVPREDIAYAVLNSVCSKVVSLCQKHSRDKEYFLTGGLCENEIIIDFLSKKLNGKVTSSPLGRYAGAIGAALIASSLK
ncbi:acyl-CoA dehydratase activase [Clostridium sp.]|uniref:acyl-CoA dehydratase activase n=1 Tax=Clostridium sp. TaxID=1506 RepID=UPI002FC95DA2